MLSSRKKKSVIDQRLRELDKEMARLNQDMNSAARERGLSSMRSGKAKKVDQNTAAPRDPGASELSSKTRSLKKESSGNDMPGAGHGRDKFVNYFAAGNLHDLRPLRQNQSVIRNKAIMMGVLALLAAFWLIRRLFVG